MRSRLPEKKEKILVAATKMFAEKGFHDVKLDQVAAAAGVAKGSIYTYFVSKDALFCNCIFFEAESFNSSAIAIIDSSDPFVTKLRQLIDLQSRFYQERGPLVKQLMQLGPQLKVGQKEFDLGTNQLRLGVELIAGFFQQGLDSGVLISDLTPVQMAVVFIQVIDVNVLSELFGEEKLQEENVFRAMIKLFHCDPGSIIK